LCLKKKEVYDEHLVSSPRPSLTSVHRGRHLESGLGKGARCKNTKELVGHRFHTQLQLQELDDYKSVIGVGLAETISTLSSKDCSTPSRRRRSRFPKQTQIVFDSAIHFPGYPIVLRSRRSLGATPHWHAGGFISDFARGSRLLDGHSSTIVCLAITPLVQLRASRLAFSLTNSNSVVPFPIISKHPG